MRRPESEKNLGDFLYLMAKDREGDMRVFLEAFLYRDNYGLRRFFPSPGLNDAARASPEELGRFLKALQDSGCFEIVVLDLGSGARDGIREAMGLCEAMVLVGNGALPDAGKREKLKAFVREVWRHNDRNFIMVNNCVRFDCAGGAEDLEEGNAAGSRAEADLIEIGYDAAGFLYGEGAVDFTLANEFGAGVRQITDRLISCIT
jgi:MinD-like ATPase involved in chromosome partitioning or flagellar assembly